MADQSIPHHETLTLIASDKVEGTPVFNYEGEKLGSVRTLMVDKKSGHVQYAVLSFGGMLGLSADYYPLPWESLNFDPDQGGYVVDVDKDLLKSAPHYSPTDEPAYDDAYGETIYSHYGVAFPLA